MAVIVTPDSIGKKQSSKSLSKSVMAGSSRPQSVSLNRHNEASGAIPRVPCWQCGVLQNESPNEPMQSERYVAIQ